MILVAVEVGVKLMRPTAGKPVDRRTNFGDTVNKEIGCGCFELLNFLFRGMPLAIRERIISEKQNSETIMRRKKTY